MVLFGIHGEEDHLAIVDGQYTPSVSDESLITTDNEI